MEVVKITPRGYCYGVVDAITLAKRVARDPAVPRPIVVLGQIVHNQHVVDELAALGIRTLDGRESRQELLDRVPKGATVIFTAHGTAPEVVAEARRRGFHVVDATCPDVLKTHRLIAEKVKAGYTILYIGQPGHPEPEGAMGVAPPDRIYLIARPEDVDQLALAEDTPIAVTTQTTLSQWDTAAIIEAVLRRFPRAEVYNEICLATQQRQEAAVRAAADVDMVVVVGDPRSNNTNRLVEVVQKVAGKPAVRVGHADELDPAWFRGMRRVAVTAGSSTPTPLTRAVIARLETF
ncbi:MAG: 4-hydroxy-3-methylbut-2-enyl diphosphate reductase [Firmicutes bacterium]|nr:4-hydroxy-3-methylbut-2-enyl diphosphate reductase [Alicyclobacillaceae bacterium]MCL6497522.1 4-hydroxy-3-methylbut-2-enyl diphosphate reductase [Bacillota bacterium]